jgi:hypothetical protein
MYAQIEIIIDNHLMSALDFSIWNKTDDPYAMEADVRVITASSTPQVHTFEFPFPTKTPPLEAPACEKSMITAFRQYQAIHSSAGETKLRDYRLLIIANGSECKESGFVDALDRVARSRGNLGIVLVDLGGYVERAYGDCIRKMAKLIVRHPDTVVSRNDLAKLWAWLPKCWWSFYETGVLEGHPGESYLSMPPPPFAGEDLFWHNWYDSTPPSNDGGFDESN